jgi:RNA polymerase sigma-70 factor (ECF subfamily)
MDTDLVTRAQRGDEEAFASLALAAGDRLHAIAHRILRDIELAEDATQQALLAIWRDLPKLRDPARFFTPNAAQGDLDEAQRVIDSIHIEP